MFTERLNQIIIVFGVNALIMIPAPATTYYMAPATASPAGNDSNYPCPITAPCLTLNVAASNARAGDTVYLRAGTYFPTEPEWQGNYSGTPSNPITISGYPGDLTPIIDGTNFTPAEWRSLFAVAGDYVTTRGIEIQNFNLGPGGDPKGYVIGVSLSGIGDIFTNGIVHDIGGALIWLQNNYEVLQNTTAYRGVLRNCHLPTAVACGLASGTSYNSSSTSGNWPECIQASIGEASPDVVQDVIIQNVTVYDCWGEGIGADNSNRTVIQDNTVYDDWAASIYVNNSTNTLVARNLVYTSADSYMTSAVISATGARFNQFALADEVNQTVPSNLSNNSTVINNLTYGVRVTLFGWTSVAGTGLVNAVVANNTFINGSLTTAGPTTPPGVRNVNSVFANNIVYGAAVTIPPSGGGIAIYHNLWSAEPDNAAGAGDVIGNPMLAGGSTSPGLLTSSYFELQESSPAIRTGVFIPQVTTNFAQEQLRCLPDIGAY